MIMGQMEAAFVVACGGYFLFVSIETIWTRAVETI
jgi:hypothetical protein